MNDRDAASGQNILPLGKPEVITYLHHAYPLSVAALEPAFCENWLFNNYLQLRCRRGLVGASAVTEFDFWLLPGHFTDWGGRLRMPQIPAELLWRSRGEIVGGVARALERELYVQIPVDEFYLPCRAAYGKRHYVHELFVFGCDRAAREVCVLGFDERLEFGVQRVGFAEFEDAVALADLSQHYDRGGVRLYHACGSAEYREDFLWVTELLGDYLAARDSSRRFRTLRPVDPGFLYGIAVHDELAGFFASAAAEPGAMDIRPLQLVWEHKRLMFTRLRRLAQMGPLAGEAAQIEQYALVVERANAVRLLGLKYFVANRSTLLGRIADGLREVARMERGLLVPILARLSEAS